MSWGHIHSVVSSLRVVKLPSVMGPFVHAPSSLSVVKLLPSVMGPFVHAPSSFKC